MHRRGAACHWCPPKAAGAWPSSRVIQSIAATLLVAVIGASTWSYGDRVQDFVSQGIVAGRAAIASSSAPTPASGIATKTAPALQGAELPGLTAPAVAAATPTLLAGEDSSATVSGSTSGVLSQPMADSTRWVPAVARTWVNIRSGAGRSGDVVGVIKPASRAMLGATGRAGWRQVRSGDTTGWVDSRLFEADSLGSRG